MSAYWKQFTVVSTEEQHLGGNLRHGDSRAITPRFWRYLVDRFGVRTLLDVGSGEGHALLAFSRMSVIAHGFDALPENVRNSVFPIALHDLTRGPYCYPCDMVHCVEVVEHIEEQYLPNLMATLTNAPIVVMTHGKPGQPGHNHVNNKPESYWIEAFDRQGYSVAMDNDAFRDISRRERDDCYFSESGFVFLKRFQ